MLVFGFIILMHCIRGSESICDEAVRPLDRLDKRRVNYIARYSDNDYDLTEGWYSVVKDGVQYLMTDTSSYPRLQSCGTLYPVGLNETHPVISEITEEPVVITTQLYSVLSWYRYWHYSYRTLKVRKCHGEIQYYLYPTDYQSGYCFDPSFSLVNTSEWSEKVVLYSITTELKFRLDGNALSILDVIPYVVFRCNFRSIPRRLYNVTWELDGTPLVSFNASYNLDDHLLSEDILLNYTSARNLHGKKLTCIVSLIDLNETDVVSYNARSDPLTLAAAMVKTNSIDVYKNQRTASIDIEFYLPVGCSSLRIWNSSACEYSLKLYMHDEWSCSTGGIANIVSHEFSDRFCTEPLHLLTLTDKWGGSKRVHTINFTTIDRTYNDATEFFLELKFDDSIGHRLWKNYTFPMIQVKVVTEGIYRNKICYSHNGLHMRSADQNYYEQYQTGIFTMYMNVEYNIEVQTKVKPCYSGSHMRCTCGLAVRAGEEVFLINQCGSINYMDFTQCGDGGILTVVQVSSRHVQVITPIGTRIDVDFRWGRFMNIDIYMSPKDEGNIVGLCGKFDDDKSNDFLQKDNKTLPVCSGLYYEPVNFSKSWLVLDENSYFQPTEMQLKLWSDIQKDLCICHRPGTSFSESLCSSTQDFGCSGAKSLAETKCQYGKRRTRKSSRKYEREKTRLFSLMKEDVAEHKRTKRNVKQAVTAEEAKKMCGAITTSLSVTDYADVLASEDPVAVTSQCETDVMEMNDASMVDLHIQAMNTLVKNIIDLTPSYAANNSEKVEYFLMHSCPRNCSGNGVCTAKGICECKENFQGDDCKISVSDPLVIDDIEGGGVCDVFEDDCRCFVIRTDNLLSGFSCNINVFEVTNYKDHIKVWSGSTVGQYQNIFTGVCCVNEEHTKNQSTAFALKYEFSISNNAASYGRAAETYIYNSTYQNVQKSADNNTDVVMLNGFCFIDDHLVEEYSTNHNSCFICIPRMTLFNWTNVCDEENDAEVGRVKEYGSLADFEIAMISVIGLILIISVILWYFAWKFWVQKKENVSLIREPTGPNLRSLDIHHYAETSSNRESFLNQRPSNEYRQPENNPFTVDNVRPYFQRARTNQGHYRPAVATTTSGTSLEMTEGFHDVYESNERNILHNLKLEITGIELRLTETADRSRVQRNFSH